MSVNVLLSYAFHADTKLDRVRSNLVCGLLLIDSGAFTAFTLGRPISLTAYAEYLEHWRGNWDHAVTLDVIGDHDATMVNTRKLHAKGLPVMPVFTRGGKIAEFEAMVRDVGYVCVGGLVGMPKKAQIQRVGLLQRRAEELGGGIHALGIGSMDTLRATRPYSADASSISGAFRFGSILFYDGRDVRSIAVGDRAKVAKARPYLRDHGIDAALLLRTGRMPGKDGRDALMQGMSVAYAVADEELKRTRPIKPPRRLAPGSTVDARATGTHLYSSVPNATDLKSVTTLCGRLHPGTHLYSSVAAGYAPAASRLDRALHGDQADVPPLWRRYAAHHTCTQKGRAHRAAS